MPHYHHNINTFYTKMQYHNNGIDLKKLRKILPWGYGEKLSKITGFSSSYCRSIIAGVRYNQEVLEAAINLAAEYKNKHQSIQANVEAL